MRSFTFSTILSFAIGGVLATASAASAGGPKTDIVTTGSTAAADRVAIRSALAQLPRQPRRIAVMDVMPGRAEVRQYLLTLDAFTVRGNDVIYVVQQSAVLKGARSGSTVYRAILATILWHEMAHLDGAPEWRARQAEEDLWRTLVRDGLIDRVLALRYLDLLTRRPDDTMLASAKVAR
jgi:hypothetical protein